MRCLSHKSHKSQFRQLRRVIGPRRLNIGGVLVGLGCSPEWRWVKRSKRGGLGRLWGGVGIGVWGYHAGRKESTVDHGRIEESICRVLSAELLPEWVPKHDWAGLNTIIQIQSQRVVMANGYVGQDTTSVACASLQIR